MLRQLLGLLGVAALDQLREALSDERPARPLPRRAGRRRHDDDGLRRGRNRRRRGAVSLPDPQAQPKEDEMTRRKGASQKQDVEEVGQPDFERAVKIFRQDIKPANEASGESAQTASTGYKAIKKDCHVNTRAAKFVFKLASESEEKRNDVLRSVRGLLGAMGIGITDDLVSGAEGEDTKAPIVPAAKPESVTLATLN
jgi:hypothetical protein